MRNITIFNNYKLNENGTVENIKTGKNLKITEKNNQKFTYITFEGKSKLINITKLIQENFPVITENDNKIKKSNKKFKIKVTQLDGKILIFNTFKAANDYYGLRKDYLNYCLTEKFYHMLTKNGLELKSVEKIINE